MDIAAMSMELSSMKLQNNVGIAVAKKAMDQQEVQASGLMEMIQQAAPPSDHIIDIKV